MSIQVQAVAPESDYLKAVVQLHGRAKATLGFLPRKVFIEQASKGCLLVAVDANGVVTGYALYDLPRREIRLTHLCVAEERRGEGVARALVEEICQRHPDRMGIRARCRRDWPANLMWTHLGFDPLSDTPGHSQAGHLLTTWWHDFGHPTLFSRPLSDSELKIVAAIDTDVFIDLDESRPRSRESRGLLADWVSAQAELVVTKEVSHDLNHGTDLATRQKQLSRASAFPQAGETYQGWQASRNRLLELVDRTPDSDHDWSDLDHVARTHAAGINHFITRDDDLRRELTKPAEVLGVRVTSPGEFITELWSSLDETYAPAQLQNTDYRLLSIAGLDAIDLASVFLNPATGEKKKHLAQRIRELASYASHADGKLVRTADGTPVALMVRVQKSGAIEVPVLRLSGSYQATIGRHIVHMQSAFARERSRSVVRITDPHLSVQTERALRDEGFQEINGDWWSVTVPMTASKAKLASALDATGGVPKSFGLRESASLLRKTVLPASLVAELEQRFWPMKVKGSDLPTFLVPIRPAFAMELFDADLSKGTLFHQMLLGIYREQVYYRSPRPSGGLKAPARLLWYVKQQSSVAGSGMIRASSYLFEVVVDRPRTLYRRNSQLGVYSQRDVEGASKNGQAMALRFGLTESFPLPVSLGAVRKLAAQRGCDNLQLQSPWKLPDKLFEDIYERGIHGSK